MVLPFPVTYKYRTGLRVNRVYMPDSVIFLILSGQFVFFDNAAQVFLATRGRDKPRLAVPPHDLPVQIKAWLRILFERALRNQFGKILRALRVNGGRIQIGAGGQVNFRFADVQKAERFAFRHHAGFL